MLNSSVTPLRLEWYLFGLCRCCFYLAKLEELTHYLFFFLCCTQVKHSEVAQFLGGRLYDCVFKYNEFSG